MNPNAPFLPGQGPQGMPGWGSNIHQDAWWQSGLHLLPLILFAIFIGVLVWGVLRLSSTGALAAAREATSAGDPPSRPPLRDHALEELRVRYARGELDRTDFLERSADLGGGQPTPDATRSAEPPAPDQG
jgi:putative membrane protein